MNLTVDQLRTKYPEFVFHAYSYSLAGDQLKLKFHFEIKPGLDFYPGLKIKGLNPEIFTALPGEVVNNFVFHLGLIEMLSYWKATCSPKILVKAGKLDQYQLDWWKDLLLKGLGEFFYTNKIDFTESNFLTIAAEENANQSKEIFQKELNQQNYLVPVGGGKDSAVTLELLSSAGKKVVPFCLNPGEASLKMIKLNNLTNTVVVSREIDQALINLNKQGFLNGHTPFTAYTTFLSSFCSLLFNIKYILMSNERSSNEGNTFYKGLEINHQYSKSYEFEKKFNSYLKKYLAKNLEYLSFLRPVYELQIAKIFSGYPKYYSSFKSCNKNQKLNTWCQSCSKCLFAYLILYPFVEKEILTTQIFSEDLFEKKELLPILKSFLDTSAVKPFDCVGTREETRLAVQMCLEKAGNKPPILLREIQNTGLVNFADFAKSREQILSGWNDKNFLSAELAQILKNNLKS